MTAATAADRLFAGGLLVLGIYIVWNAVAYGYMREAVPGSGFFPFWVGAGLIALSAANLLRSLAGKEVLAAQFDLRSLYQTLGIIGVVAVFILIAPWTGMLPASGVLLPAIAFAVRPRWSRRFAATIIALSIAFPVFCYFLFAVYLRVPLVRGVFGF